jgi:hypothetical protein
VRTPSAALAFRHLCRFLDAGITILPRAVAAGVQKAPRHEVAGGWAPAVQRALWGFGGGAELGGGYDADRTRPGDLHTGETVRANDFRFFRAFGGCRAQQRTTPIYATALRRTFLAHQNFVLRGPSAPVGDQSRDSYRLTRHKAKYQSDSSP